MDAQEIIAELRAIRHFATEGRIKHHPVRGPVRFGTSRSQVMRRIEALEDAIAGRAKADFTCDVVGFDTVLSYLAKHNPEALELMDEPVHGTITDGKRMACLARGRGLPVIQIEACAHMKRRFPKARYVNAYPTHLLAEYFG